MAAFRGQGVDVARRLAVIFLDNPVKTMGFVSNLSKTDYGYLRGFGRVDPEYCEGGQRILNSVGGIVRRCCNYQSEFGQKWAC